MKTEHRNLYVICNWNDRAREIVRELRSDVLKDTAEPVSIVVVAKAPDEREISRSFEPDDSVAFDIVEGDPCDWKVLHRAGVTEARSVIVLADDELVEYGDCRTAMIVLTLVHCLERRHGKSLPLPQSAGIHVPEILAEFTGDNDAVGSVARRNAWHREIGLIEEKLGSKFEQLRVARIGSRIFAQQARTGMGGLGDAYDELLSFRSDDCEIYRTWIAHRPGWSRFGHVVRDLLESTGHSEDPMIPVGLMDGDRLRTNPAGALPGRAEHELVLMAYKPPPEELPSPSGPLRSSTPRYVDPIADQDKHRAGAECSTPEAEPEEETMLPNWVMRGHYVICHWNDRAPEIIAELRCHEELIKGNSKRDRVPVIVLTRKTVESSMLDRIGAQANCESLRGSATMDVYFRPADPTSVTALTQVNAHLAKSIIVLADDAVGPLADARSLQCLLAIKSAVQQDDADDGQKVETKPHVVVEIIDQNDYAKFRAFEKEFEGGIDIIRGESLRTRILAQAARTPGLIDFYYDLLTHDSNTNEFYRLDAGPFMHEVANGADPVTFPEVAVAVIDRCQAVIAAHERNSVRSNVPNGQRDEMIPVGVWRDNQVFLNPRPKTDGYVMQDGDCLLVIAYQPPEIEIPATEARTGVTTEIPAVDGEIAAITAEAPRTGRRPAGRSWREGPRINPQE